MSRVGEKPISIPAQVKVTLEERNVSIEGPKGKLALSIPSGIRVERSDAQLLVKRESDEKGVEGLHGLTRTLVANMIDGVTQGYTRELEIQGVGYRAQVASGKLELYVGLTHPVSYPIPQGITVETPKPTVLVVKGIDKALVGQVAARIRSFAKPEPYKGKGIRYLGEIVRRKAGKAVA
jgi:large subunit ribosomal protein L6